MCRYPSATYQLRILRKTEDEALAIDMSPAHPAPHQRINQVPVPGHHVERQVVGEVEFEQFAPKHRLAQVDAARPRHGIGEHEAAIVMARTVHEAEGMVAVQGLD